MIDASLIGAAAVSLSTAYAIGDVLLSIRHSLHRKVKDAKGFYAVYCGLIVIAAGLVLTPNAPLGLLTNAVQTLAGVLLPSATVFLLLLCNDKEVVGPWANTRGLNLFTGAVIAVLVILSAIGIRHISRFQTFGPTVVKGSRFNAPEAIAAEQSSKFCARGTSEPGGVAKAARGYLVLAGGLVLVRIIMLAMNK